MRCQDEAGKRAGLHDDRWDSAGRFGRIGWHTFQHTYRSWLDATGAPLGVQQKLMRHADIRTTMNVYGDAASAQSGGSALARRSGMAGALVGVVAEVIVGCVMGLMVSWLMSKLWPLPETHPKTA